MAISSKLFGICDGTRNFEYVMENENGMCVSVLDRGGKNGANYGIHGGFCLETQYYLNSMKYPHFPSPVLKAGEKYSFTTAYKFYIK